MRNYKLILILLLIVSCSKYKGEPKSLEYDSIEIEFDGLKGDFYKKGNISLSFTDKEIVKKLNTVKNKIKKAPTFSTLKPVMYQIDLHYKNSKTNEQLLITINSNTNNEIIMVIGNDYFINEDIYSYISSLIKLEYIKNYNGELTQNSYEKEIQPRSR